MWFIHFGSSKWSHNRFLTDCAWWVVGHIMSSLQWRKEKERKIFRSFWLSGEFTRPNLCFYLVLHMDPSLFLFIHCLRSVYFIHSLSSDDLFWWFVDTETFLFCFVLFCVDVYVCVLFFSAQHALNSSRRGHVVAFY
jgi:hypothetical protein